ncbi:MAG: NAD-dependent epimerase [Candidatus Rokuibacteriota bacterium]|nr:MAG: NAD-dependent epimerase [Candidatus Rokubacteria bacterium]
MRVLVTGGAGFIGSAIARRLVDDKHDVVVVDNLSTGSRENVPLAAELVELDVAQAGFVRRLPSGGYDAVCHLAAQSAGVVSAEDPYYDLQANAASTLLLTRWCIERGVRRFLYASSMAAYGDVRELPAHEDASPSVPVSYYGLSKLASEHLLRLASREGLSVTSFRMFSVYGPGQNLGNLKQGMASIYLAYLLRGEPVPVTGSLERFRDFVYIDDAVEAWMAALALGETTSPVYNVGSGSRTTVRELLAALKAALGLRPDHPVQENPGSPSDQFGIWADIRRIAKELQWRPTIPLEVGLRRMVAWAVERATPEGRW